MTTVKTTTQRGYGRQWQLLCTEAYRIYGHWCYRCNRPIDPALPKTSRWSRTINHNNAVARHGASLPRIEDVRPMHRYCNSSLGARPMASQQRPLPSRL